MASHFSFYRECSHDRTEAPLAKKVQIISCLLGMFVGVAIWKVPAAVFVLTIIWVVGQLVHHYAPSDDRRFVTQLFWWGICTRLVLSSIAHVVAIYFEHGYPYLLYGQQSYDLFGDSAVTSLRAFWMAQFWNGKVSGQVIDLAAIFGDRTTLLVRAYGGFYYLFGFSPLALKWINCLLGTLCGIVAYQIGQLLFLNPRTVGRITGVMVMFFPSTLLWSLSNLKETPTTLMLCLVLRSVLRLERQFRWHEMGWLAIWLVLLGAVRWTMIVPTIGSLLVAWWFTWPMKLRKKLVVTTGLISVLLLGIVWHERQSLASLMQQRLTRLGNHLISVQRGLAMKQESSSGYYIYPERVYRYQLDDNHPSYDLSGRDWYQSLVKGLTYFLFAPFPWSLWTKLQVVSYPELVLWYALIPLWMRGAVRGMCYRPKPIGFLLTLLLALSVTGALVSGNIGTAFRHRAVVVPILLLLSALGITQNVERIRRHRASPVSLL